MSLSNKDLVQYLYQKVWNERKLELAEQLISRSHGLHVPVSSGSAVGPEAYKREVKRYLTAFPDLRWSVEELVSEKDKLVAAWTMSGTHKGEFLGLAPTNRKVSLSGITIHQIANGKILDSYALWDILGLFQQLGVPVPVKMDNWAVSAQ
jgi:steroid delta-isomerase-like uncharacterized protein